MHAAVRRFGVPSPSIRALALLLAGLVCAGVMAVLVLGLSMRAIEAARRSPTLVRWIPLPSPEPAPEPVFRPDPRPEPRRPAPAAPSAAAARPDTTLLPVAPPAPLPQPAPVDGSAASGTAPGSGTGTGSAGDGSGGDGGGAPRRARAIAASWVVQPDLLPFYPALALRGSVDGKVLLECRILRSQRVEDCRVLSARPNGYGFGKAALAAAKTFRLNPPLYDGRQLEELRVTIPVDFNNIRARR